MHVEKYWVVSIPATDLKDKNNACHVWIKSVPHQINHWMEWMVMNIVQFAMFNLCLLHLVFAVVVDIFFTSNA